MTDFNQKTNVRFPLPDKQHYITNVDDLNWGICKDFEQEDHGKWRDIKACYPSLAWVLSGSLRMFGSTNKDLERIATRVKKLKERLKKYF